MKLHWDKISRDFYRSRGSRFDILLTGRGDWLAVDADGATFRDGEFGVVKNWCEQRERGQHEQSKNRLGTNGRGERC